MQAAFYKDCAQPEKKIFVSIKQSAQQYHMGEDFYKKWSAPVADSPISYLNKTLAGPVDKVTVFKVELKALFILIV